MAQNAAAAVAQAAQAMAAPRPDFVKKEKPDKPLTPDHVENFLDRNARACNAISLPANQWVRHMCVLLRDAPAQLMWAQLEREGAQTNPATFPHETLTWADFSTRLRAVYRREDYLPGILKEFQALRYAGVHDNANFLDSQTLYQHHEHCRHHHGTYVRLSSTQCLRM